MTYTEKRLEDSTLTPKILDILAYQQVITNQGENYTGEKDWALNKLKSLISESIAQAVAKERARVGDWEVELLTVVERLMDARYTYNSPEARTADVRNCIKSHVTALLAAEREAGSREERERIEMELMNAEKHSHPGEQGLFVPWTSIKTALNPPTK